MQEHYSECSFPLYLAADDVARGVVVTPGNFMAQVVAFGLYCFCAWRLN